jgi:DNA-binding LacI/PurR family transcriptional regulator
VSNKRARIEDVATAARVSTQTVSRVLNNRPEVLPATRQRVLDAMTLLGYEPSLFARGLAGNKSHLIGMIAEDLSEPMMAHFVAAVELETKRLGYFLLVSSNTNPHPENPIHAQMLASSHVDGILFSRLGEGEQEKTYLQELLAKKIPLVALGDWPGTAGKISSVALDEVDGGYRATSHLLELGHRQIGMLTGPAGNSAARSRAQGYEQALREFGLTPDPGLVIEGDWTFGSGFRGAITLLERCPTLSAVFCQNDRMAIAALQAFQQNGRRVPDDISLIGFDDIPDAAYTNPALTTMRQSTDEIGRVAVELMFDKIQKPNAPLQRIQVKATLVERASCCIKRIP